MSGARPGLVARALVLVVVLAGCDLALEGSASPGSVAASPPSPGTSGAPGASSGTGTASPNDGSASPSTCPAPLPTPEQYVVQRGDTLTRIARMFGITVPQLLAANPQVRDPNAIRFGYPLTVPPRDSLAVMYRGGGGMIDPTGDVVDRDDQLTQAPGYGDLERFTARIEGSDVIVELDAVSVPPPLDPEGEELRFVLQIDVTADLDPEIELTASNALVQPTTTDDPAFGMSLLDRRTGTTATTPNVPGSVATVERRLEIRVALAALGDPQQVAVVAAVEREFYPDGRAVPDTVEASIDRVPDQQWPRANPRWLVITRAP